MGGQAGPGAGAPFPFTLAPQLGRPLGLLPVIKGTLLLVGRGNFWPDKVLGQTVMAAFSSKGVETTK